ncbi:MAG: S8 family serine peptidase [candidate division WOR-3 bacterium]
MMVGSALILVFTLLPQIPGKLTPELLEILNRSSPGEKIFVIVHMSTEYPYAEIENLHPQEKCKIFEQVARNSQKDIINYLKRLPVEKAEVLKQFWIFNGFHLKATKHIIYELAKRDDIWFICHNGIIKLDDEVLSESDITGRTPGWNIIKIKTDSCWLAGYSGAGVIVGHIDTGVMIDHPALEGKWLLPYWYDAVNFYPRPYDDHGHGTFTMGTLCGGDGFGPFGEDVGVAFGVKYIATKAFDSHGSGQYAWIDACMQYLADLKAQGVNICIINNSWGSANGSDLHWWNLILTWKNLEIFAVFGTGSSGPGSGTVVSPASYPLVAGIGATDSSDNITSFSSRGPAPNISPINDPQYWFYPTWNLLKPDFSAPGQNIRSCYNNGGYANSTGSGITTPHVAGGAAILLEKNPELTVNDIYDFFRIYCDQPPQGAPYPNNNYGWGRVNLWRSLQNIPPLNMPNIVLANASVVNDNNSNGKLDPGEDAGIVCYLKNSGGVQASNVQAILRTTSNYVIIYDSTYFYGTISSGDTVENTSEPFVLSVLDSTPPGHISIFQLTITSAETTWTRSFYKTVGIAPGTIIWGPKTLPNFPTSGIVYGISYDAADDKIYVVDFNSPQIYCYSSDSFVTYYGTIPAPEDSLTDITYSPYDDALYVIGLNPKIVWKIDKTTGAILRQFDNPAIDYPVGIVLKPHDTLWFADRRTALGTPQLLYIGDTLGNANQYNNPVQGYYNSRCLAYDAIGNSFIQAHTWYDSHGNNLDSAGVVEIKGEPPMLTSNLMLLNPAWHIRGVEFDPRDGNYWVTIAQVGGSFPVRWIVKVRGFYTPTTAIKERKVFQTQKGLLNIVPNPFQNHCVIKFQIPSTKSHNPNGNVGQGFSLAIYDVTGRMVRDFSWLTVNGERSTVFWDGCDDSGRNLPAGVYFVRLDVDDFKKVEKVIFLR